jgi:hypothetical protein
MCAALLVGPAALSVPHTDATAVPLSHCPLASCGAGTGSLGLFRFPS